MHKINNVTISAIAATVPSTQVSNLSLAKQFGEAEVKKLVKNIGVETRHVATENQTTADFCYESACRVLKALDWEPDSVGALIFVSQTPEYQLPPTACILQSKLNLGANTIAYDINLGCSGYTYGLYLASTLINSGIKRVLLLVGDTISKIVKPNDRSTELLFGDAGTATGLEKKVGMSLSFTLGTDGSGFEHIIAKDKTISDSSVRGMSSAFLEMDGGEVFKFTLETVPKMINEFLHELNLNSQEVNACIYHQANRFMLKHLSKKSKFTPEQVPLSIVDYGNTSSASIPLTLCSQKLNNRTNIIMAGFGVGLSWGAVYADLSDTILMDVVEV
jgi:3-oxoacyl-[acyl-carrier-protein] synthase-3